MYDGRVLPLATLFIFLLSACLTRVSSQGLMGGFKGSHRGSGAIELLLATGILAKLLNHRAKHGPSYVGRHMLHALLGGARYPPRYASGRFPVDIQAHHPSLLQDDLIEPHASMAMPFPDELMLNAQESALFASKSPLLMGSSLLSNEQLLAEAQISQQLLAARRARKLLEARKLLAAQEAKSILAAQREAAQLLAAQEAAQTATLLAPSRQIFTAAAPPPRMIQQQQGNQGNQGQAEMMGSDRRMAAASRSDRHQRIILPPSIHEQKAAQIIAQLQRASA